MRKFGIAALAVASLVGASAMPASAAAPPAPCEMQRALFEKYNIELGMHSEEVEFAYSTVCSITG